LLANIYRVKVYYFVILSPLRSGCCGLPGIFGITCSMISNLTFLLGAGLSAPFLPGWIYLSIVRFLLLITCNSRLRQKSLGWNGLRGVYKNWGLTKSGGTPQIQICIDRAIGSLLHSIRENIMLIQNSLKRRSDIRLRLFTVACVAGWATVVLPVLGHGGVPVNGMQPTDKARKLPAFEVVSVRPNKSGKGLELSYAPDGFSLTNLPIQPVIVNAYNLRDPKLIIGGQLIPGAPRWVNVDPYDIRAKMSDDDLKEVNKLGADQKLAQTRLMLQSMLADRFKLRIHHVMKQAPCYALVVEKGGPKVKEAKSIEHGFPDGRLFVQPGSADAQGVPLAQLAFALTAPLNCSVQDKTGLTGRYSFTLQYSPDQGSGTMPPRPEGGQVGSPPPDTSGPSLFTAVREQLGLRLIPTTVPVDSIVIDHIERPSPN
jgi:uncharacterized protein (TIGR03435 family)